MIKLFEDFVGDIILNEKQKTFLTISDVEDCALYGISRDNAYKGFEFDYVELLDKRTSLEEFEQKLKEQYNLENGYGLVGLWPTGSHWDEKGLCLYNSLEYTVWSNETKTFYWNHYEHGAWKTEPNSIKTIKTYHKNVVNRTDRWIAIVKIDDYKKIINNFK